MIGKTRRIPAIRLSAMIHPQPPELALLPCELVVGPRGYRRQDGISSRLATEVDALLNRMGGSERRGCGSLKALAVGQVAQVDADTDAG